MALEPVTAGARGFAMWDKAVEQDWFSHEKGRLQGHPAAAPAPGNGGEAAKLYTQREVGRWEAETQAETQEAHAGYEKPFWPIELPGHEAKAPACGVSCPSWVKKPWAATLEPQQTEDCCSSQCVTPL